MDNNDQKKRYLRHLKGRIIIFLISISALIYVFGFKWNGFEIKLILFVFLIMSLASLGMYFLRYLDAKNIGIIEFIEAKSSSDRYKYLIYIVVAIIAAVAITKLIIHQL